MDKQNFYILGLITLFGFSSLGAAILYFASDIAIIELFAHGWSWYLQIFGGLGYGLGAGLLAALIIKAKFMKPVADKYSSMMDELELNYFDVIFISFCAGYGEEILFRGAIQHYIGIWPAAIIFVAIHGYLRIKDWRISVYGLFMVLVIGGLGYMYQYMGMISVIAAHFMIDVVLLQLLVMHQKNKELSQEIETE